MLVKLFHIVLIISCILSLNDAEVIALKKRSPKHAITRARSPQTAYTLGGGIDSLGLYYATISLGSPAQQFDVQVDSGSSDLLIFGSTCSNCGRGTFYNPTASSSFSTVPCSQSSQEYICEACGTFQNVNSCGFFDSYGDGSNVNGSVVLDTFGVGGITGVTQVYFGVITSASNDFEPPPVDGIWGISYPDLAFSTPVIDYLVSEKKTTNTFSMCLQEGNAVMSIGMDYSMDSRFQWTPIVKMEYYNVEIAAFAVNGVSIGLTQNQLNNPFTIVDSGTTYLILEQSTFDGFSSSLQSICGKTSCGSVTNLLSGRCETLTASERASYPPIQITLSGITNPLTIGYQQYLIDDGGGAYCLGIANGGVGGGTILGDVFMQNFHVVFDRTNNKIGFADNTTCPTAGTYSSASKNWSSLWMISLSIAFIIFQFV